MKSYVKNLCGSKLQVLVVKEESLREEGLIMEIYATHVDGARDDETFEDGEEDE